MASWVTLFLLVTIGKEFGPCSNPAISFIGVAARVGGLADWVSGVVADMSLHLFI
jgi:hypothetical protein